MTIRSKKKGIVECIHMRQLGIVCYHRFNHNLLRKLMCDKGGPTYVKCWDSHSKTSIYYENRRLYFDNYRTCFTICGLKGVPQVLYSLPKVDRSQTIKSCLCCQVITESVEPWPRNGLRSCLLAVAAHGWMSRYDMDTGEVSWETQGHSVFLKSLLNTDRTRGIVCSIAVFTVFPLDFVAMIEVSKRVFGNDTSDVMVSDGLLVISHNPGSVKIYDLWSIIQNNVLYEAKLGEKCEALGGVVGEHPFGLPLNVHINECPPVLFNVTCGDNDLAIGGFPWQYIIQTIKNHNIFKVSTLEPPYDVNNGVLKYEKSHIEPDRAIFHHDESGRIIHYSSTEFRVLKLVEIDHTNTLEVLFKISFDNISLEKSESLFTSSGRRIKKNLSLMNADEAFQHSVVSFHYEDDLDLLSILVADPVDVNQVGGSVNFYDNDDGILIKSIKLTDHWQEDSEHHLILDCDVLIHIVKNPRTRSSCYVYALDRPGKIKQ